MSTKVYGGARVKKEDLPAALAWLRQASHEEALEYVTKWCQGSIARTRENWITVQDQIHIDWQAGKEFGLLQHGRRFGLSKSLGTGTMLTSPKTSTTRSGRCVRKLGNSLSPSLKMKLVSSPLTLFESVIFGSWLIIFSTEIDMQFKITLETKGHRPQVLTEKDENVRAIIDAWLEKAEAAQSVQRTCRWARENKGSAKA